MEIWLPIKKNSRYEVSNHGKIRNAKSGREMRSWRTNSDYEMICLRDQNGKHREYIHRLVADAFCEKRNDGLVVNHIDGNKSNNFAENLEWCTAKENTRHAIETGLFTPYRLPQYSPEGKKVRIVETGETFDSLTDCAKHINGFKTAVSACLLGKVKTHKGYHFEAIE